MPSNVDAKKSIGRAVSRMTGSGLAGVTSGVEASVTDAVKRAQDTQSAQDALRKEDNEFKYASLSQQAEEGKANRALSLYVNRPRPSVGGGGGSSTPGLDVFGQPMAGSAIAQQLAQNQRALDLKAKEIKTNKTGTGGKKQSATSAYPNIGQEFPGLF